MAKTKKGRNRPLQKPMRKEKIRISGLWVITFLLLAGCATGGLYGPYVPPEYIPPSSRETAPELGITFANEDIDVTLVNLITPNGPGSWAKDIKWDEYILTIKNLLDQPLVIEKIRLIDPRGLSVGSGNCPPEFEMLGGDYIQGGVKIKEYKDMGIKVEEPRPSPGAIKKKKAESIGMGAGAFSAVVITPLTSLAAGAWMHSKMREVEKDRDAIWTEFDRRRLITFTSQIPWKNRSPFIVSKASTTGSAFYPTIPNPKALVVDYRIGNETKMLEVSLEKLAGLHVAPEQEKR